MDAFLRIYLNDQHALGVLWRELAFRARRNNAGTEYGDVLERVSSAIAEDVATFASVMDRLGFARSRVKTVAAAAGERLLRAKPNGDLGSYTALARFEELELLAMGIEGKKVMWTTLRDFARLPERLPGIDFDALIERADAQRAELEPFRARAGSEAFALRRP